MYKPFHPALSVSVSVVCRHNVLKQILYEQFMSTTTQLPVGVFIRACSFFHL